MKIGVIGSLSTDFVVTTKQIPKQGETVLGDSFNTYFGGKGANQAIAASRAGAEVFMLGSVGSDYQADLLLNNLKENNVDISMMKKVEGVESGSAHIQIKDGDNRIIVVPGSNAYTKIDMIQFYQEKLKAMDVIVLQNEIPIETVKYVIDFCHEQSIKVLYNPAPVADIGAEYIEKVDFLTPNEGEFAILFPDDTLDDMLEKYPNKLIVTLGDRGAIYHNGLENVIVKAEHVTNVVDTTGAGDTFNGYLAKGIAEELSLLECLKLGNKSSALSIQKKGAQRGIPFIEEIE